MVDIYYKLGKDWHRAVFTSSEMLFAGRSPYEDDLGGSICPIIGTSWEVSRGGALFPHLYAPLGVADVAWAQPLALGPDGAHVFPEGMA